MVRCVAFSQGGPAWALLHLATLVSSSPMPFKYGKGCTQVVNTLSNSCAGYCWGLRLSAIQDRAVHGLHQSDHPRRGDAPSVWIMIECT